MLPCSEVTRLCLPLLDMSTVTALSISSKQLRRDVQVIGRDGTPLFRKLFEQEMDLAFTTPSYGPTVGRHQRIISRLKEFVGLCCSLYGLIALPSVLGLQSLLLHTTDSNLCKLLVSAGARITDNFVTTAALGNSFPTISIWMGAFDALVLPTGLSPVVEAVCSDGLKVLLQEVTQLQPEDLFKLAALQTTYTKELFPKNPTPPGMWPPTEQGFNAVFMSLPQAKFWRPAVEISQLLQLACIR